MIPIPLATYKSTVKGRVFKEITCEHCNSKFVYLLTREAEGFAMGIAMVDLTGANDYASNKANAELRRSLERGMDPVPCPSCGWYQSAMIPLIRRDHRFWMFLTGMLSFLLGGLIAIVGVLSQFSKEKSTARDGISFIQGGAWLVAIGLGLIFARKLLASFVEPNGGDPEERKELGRQRARTREEFDRMLAAEGDSPK